MHAVLLIDEVLETVLENCSEWDRKIYRWTLCQLARSCKAWSDPSLDRLWRKLNSAEPLLSLTSAKTQVSPIYRCCLIAIDTHYVQQSYAARVKHINFSSPPSGLHKETFLFPNLQSATLQHGGCLTPVDWLASTKLREINVVLAMTAGNEAADNQCKSLALILRQCSRATISSSHTALENLRIRGWMTPVLNEALCSLKSLRSLILHTGKSLTAQTLTAVASFPHLQQLSIHASDIDGEDLIGALLPGVSFPSLRSLRIRGQRSLFCAILDIIPHSTLRSLYLETEDYDQGSLSWKPTFSLLASKAPDTLIDFTIDQLLEPEEITNSLFLFSIDTRLALETLHPLSALKALRRFTVDAMVLPDFTDKDIEQIGSWWPHLEHLDLGALPGVLDHIEVWTPKITLSSLNHLAKHCASLRSLTLPLDISNAASLAAHAAEKTQGKLTQQVSLRRLLVGPPPAPDAIPGFVRNVLDMFPCVEEIECTSVDKSLCVDIPQSLKDVALADDDRHAGMMDGYANGQ